MEQSLKGKVALVTGANGGLGNAVTPALLQAGASVIGVSPSIKQSDFKHPSFVGLAANITDAEAAKNTVDAAVSRSGKLDIFVHLVGGFAGGETVGDTDDETFQRMLDMNLNSAFYLLRAVIPQMRKSKGGRIIAIGSRAALEPGAGVGAYSASKAALVALIRTVALENRDTGITANVILPGTMDTPANRQAMSKADFSKWVQPANVASLIVWLAVEAGKDVNGAAIPIYGGDL